MKKILMLALFCALGSTMSFVQGQRKCNTVENQARIEANDREVAGIRARIEAQTARFVDQYQNNGQEVVYTIPVVVHVLYSTSAQNITDAQIQSQIDVLNADFRRQNSDAGNTPSAFSSLAADCEINFCLASTDPNGNPTTGITRTSTTVTSWSTNDAMKYSSSGGKDAWPRGSYLNLWVCNLGGGILGYAQFPGGPAATDGVVIGYKYFGTVGQATAPFNLGRTGTHEVGHWLNLNHIWGDDGTSCSGTDNVSDTPNQAGENYGCPSFPRTDACSGGNGVMFMNYMDYTDDACMNMFTQGQKARMVAQLASGGQRSSLASSTACSGGGGGGGGGTSYCASQGNSVADEWIQSVVIGANSKVSGSNGGYADFTGTTWSLNKGTAYSITLTPGFTSTTYNEYWRIWVDLNGDGDFGDSGELIYDSGSASSAVRTGSMTIPTSATATTTRMRVSMKYNAAPTECEAFAYGEVEDYTVSLDGAAASCGTASGLSASSVTYSSATLNWGAVSGATSYNVQYRAGTSGSWTSTSSTSTSKAITGLAASTTYQFQVQAVCSVTGSYSSVASFTTSAAPSGCSDPYESNNTSSSAAAISINATTKALIGVNGDKDYFKFSTTASTGYKVRIDLSNLAGDYDVRLYRNGSSVGVSQNGSTNPESIVYNSTSAANYVVYVYGYNGAYSATQCYDLQVSVGVSNFRESGVTEVIAKEGSVMVDEGMEVFPNPTKDMLFVQYNIFEAGNANLSVMDLSGKIIVQRQVEMAEGLNQIDLNLGDLANGMYIVRMQTASKITNQKVQVLR